MQKEDYCNEPDFPLTSGAMTQAAIKFLCELPQENIAMKRLQSQNENLETTAGRVGTSAPLRSAV